MEIKGNSDSIGVTVYIATPINPYDAQELLKRSELVIKMLYERDREREMDRGGGERDGKAIIFGEERISVG